MAKNTTKTSGGGDASGQDGAEEGQKPAVPGLNEPPLASGLTPNQSSMTGAEVAAEAAARDEKTVTMLLPREVRLQEQPGLMLIFPKGICEIPERLKDHWYLAAAGAKPYSKKEGGDK